jgi:hypothetical protein
MDDLNIITSFVTEKTGIKHTNRLRLRAHDDYLQVWLKSGVLGSASIRLDIQQIDQITAYFQEYKSRKI